jgi:photosystem II stability/assembly factor-like uncharacterized protein
MWKLIICFMKRYRFSVFVLIAWVAFALPTRAQYICQTTVPYEEGHLQFQYNFTALDCNGNNCTAAALAYDYSELGYRLLLFRSENGGLTWTVQDPRLPVQDQEGIFLWTVEQIDSLNVIAIGDSGLVIHTSDGGATWQQQILPTTNTIEGVSFSDPLDGIIVSGDTSIGPFVTSDGGDHWSIIPFVRVGAWQCHDYGQGKYRIFLWPTGQTYTTIDNWKTIDSTGPIYTDSGKIDPYYELAACSFGSDDTMIGRGTHWRSGFSNPYPLITRTTDGGTHWNTLYDDTNGYLGDQNVMSDINRDTIVASISQVGSGGARDNIFRSIDRGATWHIDSMIFPDSVFWGTVCNGIALNPKGDLVGSFGLQELFSSLIIGEEVPALVYSSSVSDQTLIYPNPAYSSVTITTFEQGSTVHLLDILGREELHETVPASGSLTMDVSSLPSGLYYITDGITRAKFVKE